MKIYKQLTYALRCQIYGLKKIGISQNKIADQLGVSQSSISRELSRNTGKRGYRINQVQSFAENCRLNFHKAIKMTADLIELIISKICIEWSPEQISGWLRIEYNILISHESICLHTWTDKRL
jgi:IS30 family transposase